MMDLAEFEDLVDRFGDDIGRWPLERRAAAQALAATSETARALLRQSGDLRRLFAAEPRIAAPADLAARILARAAALHEPPPPPPPSARVGIVRRFVARFGGVGGRWPQPVGHGSVRMAVVLAGCFVAGFALGNGRLASNDGAGDIALRSTASVDLFMPILR